MFLWHCLALQKFIQLESLTKAPTQPNYKPKFMWFMILKDMAKGIPKFEMGTHGNKDGFLSTLETSLKMLTKPYF